MGRLSERQVKLIEEAVRSSDGPGITVAELARACGFGARSLPSAYHRATGRTLRELIARARIDRAKDLLTRDDLMVKQIAHLSGFRSPAAFGAAFRAVTGRTPNDYRTGIRRPN